MTYSRNEAKIPPTRAFLWIFLWTLAISGSAWLGWFYYVHLRGSRSHDPQYNIEAIVQSHPQKEGLKTVYLAELLKLSLDNPTNLYDFDIEEGRRSLLGMPLIKEASIKRIRPGTLFIQYDVRVPIAFLGDYSNTALDDEGILFPFNPFFTPKRLPTLILGFEQVKTGWGESLKDDPKMRLAFEVLKAFFDGSATTPFFTHRIDVSKAFDDSEGQRQIVVSLKEQFDAHLITYHLRLHPDFYLEGVQHFLTLREHLIEKNLYHDSKELIIDLRLPHLAFLKGERS